MADATDGSTLKDPAGTPEMAGAPEGLAGTRNVARPSDEAWSWTDWSRTCWDRHLAGARWPTAGHTLPELALATAAAYPDRLAISIDGEAHTFATLLERAGAVAGWLGQRTALGDRVLLAAPSTLAWAECYLGVLLAGDAVLLANPTSTAAELLQLAADSGAALALSSGETIDRCAGLTVPTADIDARPWQGTAPVAAPPAALGPDHIAVLAYTSGTTGRPKGVPLTHANLVSSISAALLAWSWRPDDVVVHALPLYHQHGLGALHAALCTGSSAAVLSRFDTAALAETAARAGGTVLFAVPAIYRRLIAEIDMLAPRQQQALRAMRLRICGSAPLDAELAGEITAALGAPALVRYGLTESGLDVSQPIDNPSPATIGIPLPGVQLRLVAGGAEVGPGVEGEVQLRGPQVFAGYWRNPAATAAAIDPDGWFSTGDIAVLDDPAADLRICGRIKEMIITGGLNVYPREVELALESHPQVAEAGVAGLPDERWGERVTAWVVPAGADLIDPTDLIRHVRNLLAPYKCPKQVFVVADLPRTGMGKLQRGRLRPPEAAESGSDGTGRTAASPYAVGIAGTPHGVGTGTSPGAMGTTATPAHPAT